MSGDIKRYETRRKQRTGSATYSSLRNSWWNKYCRILILLCCFSTRINAQIAQTNRIEIPVFSEDDNFEIIHAGISGLFLTRRVGSSASNFIELIKLDTAFAQVWSGFLPIEKNYYVAGKRIIGNNLYLLTRIGNYTRSDLIVYSVNQSNGTFKVFRIKSFIPFSPTEFQVTNKAILVGGYFNSVPVVVHYDLATFQSRVLPGLFNEAGELNQIKINDDDSFQLLIAARNALKQHTLWLKSYDPSGNLLMNYMLKPDGNSHLLFGRTLTVNGEHQIIAGVFGNRNKEFSKGMFIANIEPSGMQNLHYYHYGDLKNFFKYMKAKREMRVKHRIERKKIKGKRARFSYRFLVHELIYHNNQYILLGEAFYPRYKNIDRTYYGGPFSFSNNSQSIQNGRVFDGYYYTHAVVMGFDERGNLLWDNSFEINDVRTFTLEQFVKLKVLDDRIALVYQFENEIRTKIIQGDQVIEGKTSDPIKTFHENEIVKKQPARQGKIEYWYDDVLFASGTQEIVSKGKNGMRRRVFYINKLMLEK